MKLTSFLFLFLLFTTQFVSAQDTIVRYQYDKFMTAAGENGQVEGDVVTKDSQGNYIVAGFIRNGNDDEPILFGDIALSENPDAFNKSYIAKYDTNSNIVWVKQFDGQTVFTNTIGVDADDNIYVGGLWQNNATFGETSYENVGSGANLYLAKLDEDGEFLWHQTYLSDVGKNSNITSLEVEADGTLYVTGAMGNNNITIGQDELTFPNTTGYILVAKYDSMGNPVWARGAESPLGASVGISLSLSENMVIISGTLTNNCTFGEDIMLTSIQGRDAFVASLDKNGNWLWAKNIGGPENADYIRDIEINSLNQIFISGNFKYSANFDGITLEGQNEWWDAYIACISPTGQFISQRLFNADYDGYIYPQELAIDDFDNIISVGSYGNNEQDLILDNITLSPTGNFNTYITSFQDSLLSFNDNSISLTPSSTAESPGSFVIPGNAQVIDNELIVSGNFTHDLMVSNETFEEFPNSTNSMFILGFNLLYEDISFTQNAISLTKVKVYPNPTADYVNFEAQNIISNISVTNLKGQIVKQQSFNSTTGVVNLSALKNGVYSIDFASKEKIISSQIVVRQ